MKQYKARSISLIKWLLIEHENLLTEILTHLNSYSAPSGYSGNRTWASLDSPFEKPPFDSS